MGTTDPEMYPRYLTLPYLGYIPYPGYKKHGIVQNNSDGYRGVRIPLQKAGKYRILCIGGSTTYGLGVDSPSQAYPAQLERLLNQYFAHDTSEQKHVVEVLNAGLEGSTSAEELQQYLFKYRYYKPDAVIIHSGINDAQLVSQASNDFQLDYTHFRRINFHVEPLRQPARFLMHSYFLSFMVIRLFYNDLSTMEEFYPQKTISKWSRVNIDTIIKKQDYQFYPFYRNSKSLYQEVTGDSTALVIFPNAINTKVSEARYREATELNARLSRMLSADFGAFLVPFSFESIDSSLWMDDCHLVAAGETKKAEILLPALVKVIRSSKK
jgi:lysophospholipase L1-like esterase